MSDKGLMGLIGDKKPTETLAGRFRGLDFYVDFRYGKDCRYQAEDIFNLAEAYIKVRGQTVNTVYLTVLVIIPLVFRREKNSFYTDMKLITKAEDRPVRFEMSYAKLVFTVYVR